jgi:8-oxo-dGTP diphosphatase
MNQFDEDEFREICKYFNACPDVKEVTIKFTGSSFFNEMKRKIEKDRRGEVVFCVIRPNGRIVTVTCDEYPDGVFRIPTGGIGYGENIIEAVFREVKEELGIDTVIDSFAGVLKIKFVYKQESAMFYSYIFIMHETGGKIFVDASDDEVSEIKEVDLEGLKDVTSSLKNITGKWRDWGKFRYATSMAVYNYLTAKRAEN